MSEEERSQETHHRLGRREGLLRRKPRRGEDEGGRLLDERGDDGGDNGGGQRRGNLHWHLHTPHVGVLSHTRVPTSQCAQRRGYRHGVCTTHSLACAPRRRALQEAAEGPEAAGLQPRCAGRQSAAEGGSRTPGTAGRACTSVSDVGGSREKGTEPDTTRLRATIGCHEGDVSAPRTDISMWFRRSSCTFLCFRPSICGRALCSVSPCSRSELSSH